MSCIKTLYEGCIKMCEIIFKFLYSFVVAFAMVITLDNITLKGIKKYYLLSNAFIGIIIFIFSSLGYIKIGLAFGALFMSILSYLNFKKKFYSIFVSIISALVCLLSYFICAFIADILTKQQEFVLDILSPPFIAAVIGMFFLSIIIGYLINSVFSLMKIDSNIFDSNSPNKLFVLVIFTIVVITSIVDAFVFLVIGDSNNVTVIFTFRNISRLIILLNVIFLSVFIGFNIVIVYFNNRNYERKIKSEFNQNEIRQLKEYTGMIESLSDDLRRFRHDYFNIMQIIKSYIENKNIDGLKEFYENELIPRAIS